MDNRAFPSQVVRDGFGHGFGLALTVMVLDSGYGIAGSILGGLVLLFATLLLLLLLLFVSSRRCWEFGFLVGL